MLDFERISALIVEINPGMRTQLRDMLAGIGVSKVQFAVSASVAVRRLRESRFDLILCEYHLGEGQDGQHLLEDLRSNEIIPLDTLFIMVTGERQYEKVMGAAELTPNDYILKPFAADTLRARLERAFEKREVFLPAWRHMQQGDIPEAIHYCQQAEQSHPSYAIDFMRLRAELHLGQSQFAEAQAIYRTILNLRPVPWAKLGLAKSLCQQKRLEEAEVVLTGLINDNPQYLDAYEWLAKVREAAGQLDAARDTLMHASTLSPGRVGRMRKVGELSLAVGDIQTAEKQFGEVVRKGKYSDFRDPEDHVRLVQAQLEAGKTDEAEATIRDLERSMAGQPRTRACTALSSAMLYSRTGQADKARAVLSATLQDGGQAASLSPTLKRELAKACFAHQLDEQGEALVLDLLRSAGDDESIASTREMLTQSGRADLSTQLEQKIQGEVRQLIATGAQLAQSGDYDGAVREMFNAVRKMPGNPHVLYNAALALLRHIEHRGWNDQFAVQARNLIAQVRRRDPLNPRLSALNEFFHQLIQKHNNRAH